MPWVSWRLPATSRMFTVTALPGLSGTGPSVLAAPPGLSGAEQAETSRTANAAAASLRIGGTSRFRGLSGSAGSIGSRAGGGPHHELDRQFAADAAGPVGLLEQ